MALSVEVADFVEHFQWLTEEESKYLPPEKLAHVREEIAGIVLVVLKLTEFIADSLAPGN